MYRGAEKLKTHDWPAGIPSVLKSTWGNTELHEQQSRVINHTCRTPKSTTEAERKIGQPKLRQTVVSFIQMIDWMQANDATQSGRNSCSLCKRKVNKLNTNIQNEK